MTTRMTFAVAVLTIGLAVAALAGIPTFIENRSIGDVVVVVGFALAVVGLALVALAIPSQRAENKKLKLSAEIDIEQLRIQRRHLWSRKMDSLAIFGEAQLDRDASRQARLVNRAAMAEETIEQLRITNADLDLALNTNANEFRRHGMTPPGPDD